VASMTTFCYQEEMVSTHVHREHSPASWGLLSVSSGGVSNRQEIDRHFETKWLSCSSSNIAPGFTIHFGPCSKQSFPSFFLAVLGFELRAPHLLGRHFPTWTTPPALFCVGYFPDRVLRRFVWAGFKPRSPDLYLLSS
jgi:hypothetical protein